MTGEGNKAERGLKGRFAAMAKENVKREREARKVFMSGKKLTQGGNSWGR